MKHLSPPSKTGLRSFRRRYPDELRKLIGAYELKVPLGRSDSPGFLARYDAAATEFDKRVEAARRKRDGRYDPLDRPLIAYLAEAFRMESLEDDETSRWDQEERHLFKSVAGDLGASDIAAQSPWTGQEGSRWAAKRRETIERLLPAYRALRAAGDLEGIIEDWREEVLELAEAKGYVVDPAGQGFGVLCRAVNDAAISALEASLERLDGREVPTPANPLPPAPGEARRSPQPVPGSRVPLLTTYDSYAAAQRLTPGVRDEWRRYIERLIRFLGHDDAARITFDNLRDWRDELLTETTRKGSVRSPVTVKDKYITAIRTTLAWAVEERLLESNVAQGIKVRGIKKEKLRGSDFTADEARAILKATLLPASPRLSPGYALARRWIPWLCAYSGARVNEFSQLRGEDVRQIDGIWCAVITPEAGTVKTQEARTVPLHRHLIDQGFLAVVKENGPGPLFYDPEKRRTDSDSNRHVKKVGERIAQWVRNDVGIKDPAIKPNHAWRHLFKTMSYGIMEERVADAIQGHAPASTGRKYGGATLVEMAAAMTRVPRFDLD